MAVQLAKSPQVTYTLANRGFVSRSNFRSNVVSFDKSRESASKAAFNAAMQRAQTNQQYWNDLLEKLRKSGGGGGGGSRFDRVTVSMQLMDFITKKMISSILENLKMGSLKSETTVNNSSEKNIISLISSSIPQNIKNVFIPIVVNISTQVKNVFLSTSKMISSILIAFSAQINKLKQLIEDDLKNMFEKLNIKGKLKKVQTILFDFFVEMKEEIKNTINFIKSFLNASYAEENAKIYSVKR